MPAVGTVVPHSFATVQTGPRAGGGSGAFLRHTWALLKKDLRLELRTRETLSSTVVFAILVLLIFTFAFDLRAENVGVIAPGILWVAFTFAGMLGLSRAWLQEKDHGALEALLLSPVDRASIYFAKMLGNVITVGILELVTVPTLAAFFNLPVLDLRLVPVLLLGTFGFAEVGTLFAAIAVNTRAREVMLPILLLPLQVPVIISSVKATGMVLDGLPWGDLAPWLNLLLVYDVIFLTVSFLVFEYVVEE